MATDQQGSGGNVWVKGGFRLALLVVGLAGIYVGVPHARPYVIGTVWFLAISFVIGLVFAAILHWWNGRRPVKTAEDDQIRLGLLDEEPRANYDESEKR